MEINITKEALNVNKVVCEKKENIHIQGDKLEHLEHLFQSLYII